MSNNEHDKIARETLGPILDLGVDCVLYMKVRSALASCAAAAEKGDEGAAKLLGVAQAFSRLVTVIGKKG